MNVKCSKWGVKCNFKGTHSSSSGSRKSILYSSNFYSNLFYSNLAFFFIYSAIYFTIVIVLRIFHFTLKISCIVIITMSSVNLVPATTYGYTCRGKLHSFYGNSDKGCQTDGQYFHVAICMFFIWSIFTKTHNIFKKEKRLCRCH